MKVYEGRIVYEQVSDGIVEPLSTPTLVAGYLSDAFNSHPLQEQFIVIPVTRKNHPLGRFMVSLGTASSALVHPREVFRVAILSGASAVMVSHNHPSGDPAPSRADIAVTRQLREAGQIMGIELLEHLIVGTVKEDPQGLGYYSFSDAGLL